MTRKEFKGLYLHLTAYRNCYSFVTYTPQTREQMIRSGSLGISEEYFNPVILDFLLFTYEHVLADSLIDCFPITYDDITIICSRQRGEGRQHEYLLSINNDCLDQSKSDVLARIRTLLSDKDWKGYYST